MYKNAKWSAIEKPRCGKKETNCVKKKNTNEIEGNTHFSHVIQHIQDRNMIRMTSQQAQTHPTNQINKQTRRSASQVNQLDDFCNDVNYDLTRFLFGHRFQFPSTKHWSWRKKKKKNEKWKNKNKIFLMFHFHADRFLLIPFQCRF